MKQVLYIVLATGLTASVSLLLGSTLLGSLRARLQRMETLFLSFIIGSGCLAMAVAGLAVAGLARKSIFLIAAGILLAFALWRGGHRFPRANPFEPYSRPFAPPLPFAWNVTFWGLYTVFGLLYLSVALGPENSLDGTAHYLADASRWIRDAGISRADLQLSVPGGVEMLFLFAFSIGKHSAAAMVEFLYLLILPIGMVAYARRTGYPRAGVLAALLVFLSPVAARIGTIAAPDLALAAILFALFYLTELASLELRRRFYIHAAFVFVFFSWSMVPWLLSEFGKPILHLNSWYPSIPLDIAVHGARLDGLLGPVFLLLPLALFALGHSVGRKLLAVGLFFAAACLGAMETRIFLPALPFLALALAIALQPIRFAIPVVLAAHVLMSWPAFLALYADPMTTEHPNFALTGTQWEAALRIEPEDTYLRRTLPGYHTGRLLETIVPDGQRILSLTPFPGAYHSRLMIDPERSAEARRLSEVVWAAIVPDRLPVQRYDFQFPEQPVRKLGLLPEPFNGQARWGLHEHRVFLAGEQLRATPAVIMRATPQPGDARFAFDGNPTTRWTSGRAPVESMGVTLDFGRLQPIDQIIVEGAQDQAHPMRLMLESSPGQWQPLRTSVTSYAVDSPSGLRKAAIGELRRSGIDWFLIRFDDRTHNLVANAGEWGLAIRAAEEGYVLFELP